MNNQYKAIGENVKIFEFAKIVNKQKFEIKDFSQIDDFVFINSGIECKIGRFVHISSFVSIIGGGSFIMDDFSGLSAGCRIITGSDDFNGPYLSNPTIPMKYKNVNIGTVKIGRHAIIGSNSIVMPDIEIPEGTTVGAGSIIAKKLDPWSIYIGYNPKKVGERSKEGIIDLESKLKKDLGLQ